MDASEFSIIQAEILALRKEIGLLKRRIEFLEKQNEKWRKLS